MNYFVIVAVCVLMVIFVFLGFRLTGLENYSWMLSAVIVGLLGSYPLIWYGVLPSQLDKVLRTIVHFDMGVSGILLFFVLIREIIVLSVRVINDHAGEILYSKSATLSIIVFSVILVMIGYLNASLGPKLVNVEIPIDNLPSDLTNIKILQISDLHAGAGIDSSYVQKVVDVSKKNNPDVIVMTGDIADGDFEKYKGEVEPLFALNSCPVLYVTGNHEYLRDSEKWKSHFEKMGMIFLDNQYTIIKRNSATMMFSGVDDPSGREVNPSFGPDLKKSLLGADDADVKILLAHQPNIADKSNVLFDLQLSGHTHAGQFFPWNLLIKIFQKYDRGLKKSGDMWVYTSQGTGYWGPPLRLGTRSEITLIRLKKK
ncbi:metallophosphoesterase [Flavobacterium sp. S87F.05.LMB.W.Kidney.N]|uniref:metallophosphoesterase n=1 Tax=Flavobacterium sp. S87F.05.LMB.W.Kidney.N TaxID=1278758 RepID=UPI00106473FD|nr:metallophosphoesterase [Flavobacterium sp. S87F.05.LMB.W.Kidney.N]TDX11246.1 hypothetical protein EDB96_2030 [Flavobacterium sp. S87F.05.LMB.W.Kidney.N]